jgi:hypothetical protein
MSQSEQQHTEQEFPVGSPSFEGSASRLPFFADATLDLAEAHDIADTPEATRPQFDTVTIQAHRTRLQVPSLQNLVEITEETSAVASSSQQAPASSPESPPTDSFIPSSPQNEKASFSRITGSLDTDVRTTTTRKPKWPRDIPWTVAFFLFVPTALLYPMLRGPTDSQLAKHPLSFATLHAITWTIVAVIVVSRWLYRSAAGGEGDHVRLQAAYLMATAAPCSVAIYAAITVTVWVACPATRWAALLPAFYTLRDVYSFRRWNRRTQQTGAGYASRIAFFQAVMSMALDILSRSLRRASFYRVLSAILFLQLAVLLWWRAALLGALSTGTTSWMLLLVTFAAGKWATATIMRVLTLLATAGVMNWCSEQGALLSDMPSTTTTTARGYKDSNGLENGSHDNGGDDEQDGTRSVESINSIPEAYRTVDASVYQSVLDMGDVLDDDYEDLDEEVMNEATSAADRRSSNRHQRRTSSRNTSNNAAGGGVPLPQHRATVKSILWTGVTINFGAIAHCGLLGGLAQFVWSQVRKLEAARTAISQAHEDFQGMQIGVAAENAGLVANIWSKIIVVARGFVRHHSDLAMTHVAAYYKGYTRAARDVATVIEESGTFGIAVRYPDAFVFCRFSHARCFFLTGLEPILHEDITTHMCTCIAGSIAGVIVLITSYLLLHQRKSHIEVTDFHVVENMLISFILSYTLIFTVLEPLRAAIKASYVSFAQNPRCLSQAYPLIFHRLSRLSESHLS